MNHELMDYMKQRMQADKTLDEEGKQANRQKAVDYLKAKATERGVSEALFARGAVKLTDVLGAMRSFAALDHVVGFPAARQMALAILDDAVEVARVQREVDRTLDVIHTDGSGLFLEANDRWLLDADAVNVMRESLTSTRNTGIERALQNVVEELSAKLSATGRIKSYTGSTSPHTAIGLRALEKRIVPALVEAVLFASFGNLATARATMVFAEALRVAGEDGASLNALSESGTFYNNTGEIAGLAFEQLAGMLDYIIAHGNAEGFDFKGVDATFEAAFARAGDGHGNHHSVTLEV